MLAKLKALLSPDEPVSKVSGEHQKKLACAALLVEVAAIDMHFDPAEITQLQHDLTQTYSLSQEECDALTEQAKTARKDATSLHEFTRIINETATRDEKVELLIGMWRIAYADDKLDKYEEHIIRRVCDLIHLGHSDFIQAKLHAKTE